MPRHHRIALAFRCVDGTAGAIHEVEKRNSIFVREVFHETTLAAFAAVAAEARAGANSVVLTAYGDRTPVDVSDAHDVRRRLEPRQRSCRVVHCFASELSDFAKRPGV